MQRNRITPPIGVSLKKLMIGIVACSLFLLFGFLINHIIMFVEFFTVKNTIITILVIYCIICNWAIQHLQIDKRDLYHKIDKEAWETERSRNEKWRCQEHNEDLKAENKRLCFELDSLVKKIQDDDPS